MRATLARGTSLGAADAEYAAALMHVEALGELWSDDDGDEPATAPSPAAAPPLTPEQAIRGVFRISKADVKRVVASKPGPKKKW